MFSSFWSGRNASATSLRDSKNSRRTNADRTRLTRRRRFIEQLERRDLLAGVLMHSFSGNGMQLTITYQVEEPTESFDLGFYRSADTLFGSDVLLDTITVDAAGDVSIGLHTKTFSVGAGTTQVGLPGVGAPEVADDYFILAVADPSSPESDGVAVFSGIYNQATGTAYIHGRNTADTITIDATHRLNLNGTIKQYSASTVNGYRIRAHEGNDTINGAASTKTIWVSGGPGDDNLRGGSGVDSLFGDAGVDTLTGNGGNDNLNGGQDGDTYSVSGTTGGTDVVRDTGSLGQDRLVAGVVNTTITLGATFSKAESGLEEISNSGFTGLSLTGTSSSVNFDFLGMTLTGVTLISGYSGPDTLKGSDGPDVFRGGMGNDNIDGRLGSDTAVFAGLSTAYSLATTAGGLVVQDLSPTVDGDDGTDTLTNVELLRFSDKTIPVNSLGNQAPTANPDTLTVNEDAGVVVASVLANDTDPDLNDTKRVVSVVGNGALGIAQVVTGGTGVLFYPNKKYEFLKAGETFVETIIYTMADAAGATSTSSLVVTVVGSNDAPFAVGDSHSVTEDAGPTSIFVLPNDTDVDLGDTKKVVSVDGAGVPDTWELVIIYGVGAPILVPGVPAILGTVSVAADSQSAVYSPGNAFQKLRAGQTATERFHYTMQDAAGAASATWVTVTVTGANDAPTALNDHILIGKNAAPVSIQVLQNDLDVDLGDTKSISTLDTTGLLGSATIAADGKSINYAVGDAFLNLPADAVATETFLYTMIDGAGAASTATVTIRINGANQVPTAADDSISVIENGPPQSINVLANDIDPDPGDTKTVIAVNAAGLLGSVAISAGGTGVVYTIGNAYQSLGLGATATESFTYTMRDSSGATSTATVTVTVSGANDAPVAVANTASVSEDATPLLVDVLANDTDVDAGDTKSVIGVASTATLKGTISVAEGGTGVVYSVGNAFQSLRAGQIATEVFSYTVADASGATSTANVTMTITGANDSPTAVDNALTITEDAGATTIAVLANDIDPDLGDTKRVVSVNTVGLRGTVTIAANGSSLAYIPGSAFQHLITGQTDTETFTYTMTDGGGATSTARVTVTINGVTDGPKANPDSSFAVEDSGPIYIGVLENDFHDQNPNELLTIVNIDGAGSPATIDLIMIYGVGVGTINPGFPAARGTMTLSTDGRGILYTPFQGLKAGETANDLFRYTIRDTVGRTSTAIVAVTVSGKNDAPVALADTKLVYSDSPAVTVHVLANDTDLDDVDTKTVVNIDTTGLVGSASIATNGAGIVYTVGQAHRDLAYGQSVQETIAYTMVDSTGLTSNSILTITVTGVNHAPSAASDQASAAEDGPAVVISVLGNDLDVDVPFGDRLVVQSVNGAGLQGSVAVEAGGNNLIYSVGNAFQTLRAGATAVETFTYVARDLQGATATGTVTVTVTGNNDGPIAVANTFSISEDSAPTSLAVLANDTDIDVGDGKSVVSVSSGGLQGSVAITSGGGSIVYTVAAAFQSLNNGQTATETFTYTMADSAGATSTASVTITIIGANEPVVIVTPPPPGPGAVVGTAGDDILITAELADVVYGEAGDDSISSYGGNDTIFGGAGRDTIDGGAGNDIINGGADRDDLTGGAGADIFRYYLATESTVAAFDRIRDFNASQGDKIDLSLIDASTLVGENNAFVIVAGFTGVAGQLVIVSAGADLYHIQGDVNGDGIADLQIEVKAKSVLTALDIIL